MVSKSTKNAYLFVPTGQTDIFDVTTEDVGQLQYIVVRSTMGMLSDAWRVDYILVTDTGTGQTYNFYVDRWIDSGTNNTFCPLGGKL